MFFPTWVVLGFVFLALPGIYFLLSSVFSANFVFLSMGMAGFYFLSYEVVHFASHLPEDHPVIKIKFFRFMRGYHGIHHNPKLMRDYNFNIVFPFFDIIFKTYIFPGKQNVSSNISS
jgi:sterol desaturase/sphingolipid hydroxylase (fatty acid hydroxylase superfamily)